MLGEEEIALVTEPAQGKTRFGGYADDIHGLSAEQRETKRCHALSMLWEAGVGFSFNPTKSKAFGDIDLTIHGEALGQISEELRSAQRARKKDIDGAPGVDRRGVRLVEERRLKRNRSEARLACRLPPCHQAWC